MQESAAISAKAFCTHHRIEISFLHSLNDYGLIDIQTANEDIFLPQEQLENLEKMVRLHFDLHINLEGLDAIYHLLQRVEDMQREMSALHNRLRLYEGQE